MNTYILIILTTVSMLQAQFSTNVLNGFGNNEDVISTFSESMGGMWMNNSNKNNWDPLLASSIYSSNLTMICVSSSIRGNKSDFYNDLSHNFEFINFSFPFKKNMGIAIGFSPNTITDYTFEEAPIRIPRTEFSSALLSSSSHIIEGGISKLSVAFSKAIIAENITTSIGIKWNILFGNQEVNSISMLKEISYNKDGSEVSSLIETVYNDTYNHFNAYQYEFDSRIIFNKKNSISLLISAIDNFKIDNDKVNQLFASSSSYSLNAIQIDRFGFGYMYNKDDDFGIAAELHFKNSIDYPKDILLFNSLDPSIISFHNGLYKRLNNIKIDSWNAINLSMGYSYKVIKFINQDLRDISCSVGAGISFNEFKNNIDMSFTIGLSENVVETIEYDNYYKLNLSIFSGDEWFKQRRRK